MAVRLLPDTLKLCSADAVPYVVVNVIAVAAPVMVGGKIGPDAPVKAIEPICKLPVPVPELNAEILIFNIVVVVFPGAGMVAVLLVDDVVKLVTVPPLVGVALAAFEPDTALKVGDEPQP